MFCWASSCQRKLATAHLAAADTIEPLQHLTNHFSVLVYEPWPHLRAVAQGFVLTQGGSRAGH